MIFWLLREVFGVSEARLAVLRQYAPGDLLNLWIVRHLRGALLRRTFYAESRDVFEYALVNGLDAERHGDRNVIGYRDDGPGELRIVLRRRTSDFIVFRQVLMLRQYEPAVRLLRCCFPSLDRPTIVDGGANVGLSSIYFARAFPGARIVAIEADAENYELCRANVAQLGTSIEALHAAVWNEALPLHVGSHRDGRAWSRRIDGSAREGDSTVAGMTIDGLIEDRGWYDVDLLKLDVEGAEVPLFDKGAAAKWLSATRTVAVETHDEYGHDLVSRELLRAGFFVFERGELMLGVRRRDVTDERLLAYFDREIPPREAPLIF